MGEVSYKGHRYPAEIIAHCVWLYHRFPLSFREVEELMLVRGVIRIDTSGCSYDHCVGVLYPHVWMLV